MKVLFHHFIPFSLAHGGQQIQIERTYAALQQLGVEVDYLRWYDGNQKGDILHFFGRIPTGLLLKARDKGMKVIIADLLGAQATRTSARLAVQKALIRGIQAALPRLATIHFDWSSYRLADACIAVTRTEAELLTTLFSVPPARVHIVPNGVEDAFLDRRTVNGSAETAATVLRRFYDTAPSAPAAPRNASWEDVARQLKSLYESL